MRPSNFEINVSRANIEHAPSMVRVTFAKPGQEPGPVGDFHILNLRAIREDKRDRTAIAGVMAVSLVEGEYGFRFRDGGEQHIVAVEANTFEAMVDALDLH